MGLDAPALETKTSTAGLFLVKQGMITLYFTFDFA
jgi:hypothetical protein